MGAWGSVSLVTALCFTFSNRHEKKKHSTLNFNVFIKVIIIIIIFLLFYLAFVLTENKVLLKILVACINEWTKSNTFSRSESLHKYHSSRESSWTPQDHQKYFLDSRKGLTKPAGVGRKTQWSLIENWDMVHFYKMKSDWVSVHSTNYYYVSLTLF